MFADTCPASESSLRAGYPAVQQHNSKRRQSRDDRGGVRDNRRGNDRFGSKLIRRPLLHRAFWTNFVQCDIDNHDWVPPRPPPPGRDDATSTFLLVRGQVTIVGYSPGTVGDDSPLLDPAQAPYAGTIGCRSDQSAMKCTDTSTGHFFRVSQESYELG
jgi:hypothetical protein